MWEKAMMRRRYLWVAGLVSVTFAMGQAGPDEPGRGRRERGGDRGPRTGRRLERLVAELQLDDAQRIEFDEVMAAQRARVEELTPQWEEMREARRTGDRERAEELRSQMGDEGGPRDLFRQAFDEIEPILNDEQYERFSEMREGMQRQRDSRRENRRVMQELPDKLGLDEEQRDQFRKLFEGRRDRMREQWSQRRPLVEEMREAEAAGNSERAAELRHQLEEQRVDPETMRMELLDQIGGLLRADQQPLLSDYYVELGLSSNEESAGPLNVMTVLRAARRPRLGGEQKARLRVIGREAMRELRQVRRAGGRSKLSREDRIALRDSGKEGMKGVLEELRRRNEEAVVKLAVATKDRIVRMLDADQVSEFERNLEKEAQRASRRGR